MSEVKSKNLYELLGNDHDQDSDKEPEPPVKTVDRPLPRAGKRDAPKTERTDAAPRRGNYERRGGGFNNEERSFRDRTNGRNNPNPNRDHPIENTDGQVRGRDSGPGVQRGGRGPRGPRRGGDRRDKTGRSEHQKQADHGWGAETGEGERATENEGERDAQRDENAAKAEDAQIPDEPIPEPEPEPEDTSVSYAAYLEQQAAKKLEGLGLKEARAPNEGSKENKKWKNATALEKENAEESYFIGEAKARRERERIQKKQVLDIDYSFKEDSRPASGRGGRGGPRGRGRGEGRGGRGEFRGRGDRGDRGSHRGGRGRADGQSVPVADDSAFPALGA